MNLPDATFGNVSLAAIAVGVIAATWSKLKTLAWRVVNLLVVRVTVGGYAETAVRSWLWQHGRRSRYGERSYEAVYEMVRNLDRRTLLGFEENSTDATVFWFGWKPVLVYMGSRNTDGAGGHREGFLGNKLVLMFFRWSFDPDKIVADAIAAVNNRTNGAQNHRYRFSRAVGMRGIGIHGMKGASLAAEPSSPGSVMSQLNQMTDEVTRRSRRYLGYEIDQIGPPIPDDPMGYLAIPDELASVLESARRWLASEKWYKKRSIPWRMGLGFVGKPGTGKTVTAKAMAQQLDLPVTAFELATFTDRDMVQHWHSLQSEAPCIALFEDIDTVFNGRTNVTEGEDAGLSFGCLLNCLSGIEGADGILTIFTTNRPEMLDKALGVADSAGRSSRPGRIDRIIELKPLDEKGRRHIATRILEDCPHEIEAAVAAGDGETGAQFTNRCAETAMLYYHASESPGDLPCPCPPISMASSRPTISG